MPRKQSGEVYMAVPVVAPDGTMFSVQEKRFDTLTCAHCSRIVLLNPRRTRDRGWCFRCDNYVCDHEVCISECNPIIQGVDLLWKYKGTEHETQPFLSRGPNGEILFNPELRDRERIFSIG